MDKNCFSISFFLHELPPEAGLSLEEAPFHEESLEMLQFQNIFLRFTSFLASSYFGGMWDFGAT